MKKVLIIDDDSELQKFYSEAFTREGITVISAYTGKEGIIKAKQESPSLIILDIMLPGGMNGFDVEKELKNDEALSHIPVLVLTNLENEQQSMEKNGIVDYIVKSNTSLEMVVRKVKTLLG